MLSFTVRNSDLCNFRKAPMPTPFEIAMSIQLAGWIAVHIMVAALRFPNSRLFHYLYDGDELFKNN